MIDAWVDVMSDASCLASLCAFQRHRQHGLALGHGEELAVFVGQLDVDHFDDVIANAQPLVMQGFHGSTSPPQILQRQFAQQRVFLIPHQARLHNVAIHHGQTGGGFVVGTGGRGGVGGRVQLVKPPVEVTREVDHGLSRRCPFFHHYGGVVGHHVGLDGPSHSVLRTSPLVRRVSFVERVTSQIVDARRRFSHQLEVLGHGQIQPKDGRRGVGVRGPHPRRLSERVHIYRQHLVVEGFRPVIVPSSVADHFPGLHVFGCQSQARPEFHPRQTVGIRASKHASHGHGFVGSVVDVFGVRRAILIVEDAHAVEEQRVLVFETQILHEGDGAVGRRQRDHGRLPLLFGGETEGFLQANLKIRVGVVGKFGGGIADEGDAYLVHVRRTRSFLFIQLSYLAGQPFQRTRTVSFLRFTTESMRNRSSSAVVTFWRSSS